MELSQEERETLIRNWNLLHSVKHTVAEHEDYDEAAIAKLDSIMTHLYAGLLQLEKAGDAAELGGA